MKFEECFMDKEKSDSARRLNSYEDKKVASASWISQL